MTHRKYSLKDLYCLVRLRKTQDIHGCVGVKKKIKATGVLPQVKLNYLHNRKDFYNHRDRTY